MKYLFYFVVLILVISCNSPIEDIEGTLPTGSVPLENCQDLGQGWSVPKNQVVGGGVGKDGIPAIENPQFIAASDVNFLLDDEIVIGVNVNGEFKAYPHRILEKHEIVNDEVDNVFYSLTFCPLTGTSVTWQREEFNSFGVSGLLHNSNLITYDRVTDSNWAQIYSRGINGSGICVSLDYHSTLEMSWDAWKNLFPDSRVLSLETGFIRNYGQPALSYSQPEDVTPLFPIYNIDERLPNYERVLLVVIEGKAKVYRFSSFENGSRLVRDFHSGKVITLLGNEDLNFIVPYINTLGGDRYFILDENKLKDIDGNVFNLFGEAISGPDKGVKLEVPYSMMGYWFAISAFYPEVEIFFDDAL